VQAALRCFGATAFPLPDRALAERQTREFEAWGRIIQAAGIKRE
jgi:hypothetical protein